MFRVFNQEDKEKGSYWKEIIKIIFGAIAVIIIIFSIAGCVIKIKDLNMIDVLYVKAIKLSKTITLYK